MKEIVLKVYKFDELSKDSQERIIERERWNVMEQCMDAYSIDYHYPHSNTLSFNWNDYEKKITQEEFDDFVNNVDRSRLPEGIKFEIIK